MDSEEEKRLKNKIAANAANGDQFMQQIADKYPDDHLDHLYGVLSLAVEAFPVEEHDKQVYKCFFLRSWEEITQIKQNKKDFDLDV